VTSELFTADMMSMQTDRSTSHEGGAGQVNLLYFVQLMCVKVKCKSTLLESNTFHWSKNQI